jgi:hypothetical protein
MNARIEEFNLERPICDWTFLPDELIETRLSNRARSIKSSINTAIFTWRCAV